MTPQVIVQAVLSQLAANRRVAYIYENGRICGARCVPVCKREWAVGIV